MRSSPAVRCALMLATLAAPLVIACGGGTAPTATPAAPQTPASAAPTAASAASPIAAPGVGPTAAAVDAPTTAPAAATQAASAAATQPAMVGPTAAASGQGGGTFVIASLGLPNTMHPYPDSAAYSDVWSRVAGLTWGSALLTFDANMLEYVPYMASEWSVAPDGKTFTFVLQDGLKWSDGHPLTVEDFLFAWQNASKEENNYVGLDDLKRIESFTTPNTNTIVVVLKEVLARDVAVGVANAVGAVPKHVWEGKSWTDTATNPEILRPTVVSGAFILKEWKEAESATFVRNPAWFKGQASFEQVVVKPGQQATVTYELLKSNQAQWAPNIPPSQYDEAKQNQDLTMFEWTAANGAYRVLEFNLEREFLKDKRAREALSRAISREDVIQVAENNLGAPQYSFLNPANTRWYNPNVEKYDFDLERSKQLLQEAGYQLQGGQLLGKDGQPVRLQVHYPVSSNPREKIAAYLQQQYKELGIEVEVRGLEFSAFTEEVTAGNYDLSLGTYGGGSIDPDLGPRGQLLSDGQQNVTHFNNPAVDDLFKKGAVELDDAKRKAIYDQIQQVVNDELPSFYLYSLTSFSPMSKQVSGVTPNKLDNLDYNDALTRWTLAQ